MGGYKSELFKEESKLQRMNLKVDFTTEANLDIDSIFNWYEDQQSNLGFDFIFELDTVISIIKYNPKLFSEKRKNIRRALIRKFPYGVYFTIRNQSIIILMVIHQKRSPKIWQQRIREFKRKNK